MDINKDKFATAKALGATDCVDSSKLDKPVQSHIVEMTKWGVDYTFDCTGVSKRFIFVVFRHGLQKPHSLLLLEYECYACCP